MTVSLSMHLSSLLLKNFRSYLDQQFTFSSGITAFIGPNAAGKTNILEAVTVLALGKSFRAGKDEEMIHFGAEFGRIEGQVEEEKLEVVLTRGIFQGKKVAKKRYILNGLGKRRQDFAGRLKVVLFEPQDILLIVGSPGKRRDYLDFVLSQADWDYNRSLLSFQKGLRQRNRLLGFIQEGKARVGELEYWNRLLVTNGEVIRRKREAYLEFLNEYCASKPFRDLWLGSKSEEISQLQFEYDYSAITYERLAKYQDAEIASGTTLVGPHRDDIFIFQQNHDRRELKLYGSRGEQRMAVLAMKLGELEYITREAGERPLLLLDDIFSELDEGHRQVVMEITKKQQSILTATEIEFESIGKVTAIDIQNVANLLH